jgi:hypothetical protein
MKNLIFILFNLVVIFYGRFCFSQTENVSLDNSVYTFLKKMSVKGVIGSINDDVPSMSRGDIEKHLKKIDSSKNELSKVDKELLGKFKTEFIISEMNTDNTSIILRGGESVGEKVSDFFSKKKKYLYFSEKKGSNLYADFTGTLYYGNENLPHGNTNSALFDMGFVLRGTFFEKLGYYLSVVKGGATGNGDNSLIMMPELKSEFKFNEQLENIRNYNFTNGYLKFRTDIFDDANISIQLGREKIKYGYGYSESLTLSGMGPDMDFLKFNFNYGILKFSSIHASTVGPFSQNSEERYTKYFAANKLKLSFEKLFDIGVGEGIIYSGRGLELAYLTPLGFYKFLEMSLQDRDNGVFFIDFQSRFLKNIEFEFSVFLDENPLGILSDLNSYENKTGFQVGTFLYEPLGISNLSLKLEYTNIRPYVYSHANPKNNYTGYGIILGNPIGPNSDQIFANANYDLSQWAGLSFEFRFTRKGNNIYDENGILLKNAGGNINEPYRAGIDAEKIKFLDGNRENTITMKLSGTYEPVRDILFELNFLYQINDKIYKSVKEFFGFSYLKMRINI